MDVREKVTITRHIMGICHMQVCAWEEATDEEILSVCNSQNPSGTTYGWGQVIREKEHLGFLRESSLPVPCKDDPGRVHLLVSC